MANNIEIKAYAKNFDQQVRIAADLCKQSAENIYQHDVFFNVKHGRLKLRRFPNQKNPQKAQLIFYQRSDVKGPKSSEYQIFETDQAQELQVLLEKVHGIKAEVRKKRLLFLCGKTRIHFDQVAGLGEFIELEVVLDSHEDHSLNAQQGNGRREANRLMRLLQISTEDLIEKAYVDLL